MRIRVFGWTVLCCFLWSGTERDPLAAQREEHPEFLGSSSACCAKWTVSGSSAIADHGDPTVIGSLAWTLAAAAPGAPIHLPFGTLAIGTTIVVPDDLWLIACGATLRGPDLDTDLLSVSGAVRIEGRLRVEKCRSFVRWTPACEELDVWFTGIDASNVHSALAGTTPTVLQCGSLLVRDCTFSDLECGVYLQRMAWREAIVAHNRGHDLHLKEVNLRNAAPYNKHYVLGVWLDMDAGTGKATLSDNVFESLVHDPGGLVVGPDYEVHALGVESSGEVSLVGNVVKEVVKLASSRRQDADCEGLLVRCERASVVGNTLVDAGSSEGAIYLKASGRSTVSGNTVVYTQRYDATSSRRQRGLIVSGDGQVTAETDTSVITGNLFQNCDRGITSRGHEGTIASNSFTDCQFGIWLDPQSETEPVAVGTLAVRANTFERNLQAIVVSTAPEVLIERVLVKDNVSIGGFDGAEVDSRFFHATDPGVAEYWIVGNQVHGIAASARAIQIGASASPPIDYYLHGNELVGLDPTSTGGRAVFAASGDYGTLSLRNNTFKRVGNGAWLRDQSYETLIFEGNLGEELAGLLLNVASVTVTGEQVIAGNVGDEHRPRVGNTASRPAASRIWVGYAYYDTDLRQELWWDGADWRDNSGTIR